MITSILLFIFFAFLLSMVGVIVALILSDVKSSLGAGSFPFIEGENDSKK